MTLGELEDESRRLREEIVYIKEVFERAIASRRPQTGMHVPYHGEFANVNPSILRDMEQFVKRWDLVLANSQLNDE